MTWDERWRGDDRGFISCWEVGRELAAKQPDLAGRAMHGERLVLGWKGGDGRHLHGRLGQVEYAVAAPLKTRAPMGASRSWLLVAVAVAVVQVHGEAVCRSDSATCNTHETLAEPISPRVSARLHQVKWYPRQDLNLRPPV